GKRVLVDLVRLNTRLDEPPGGIGQLGAAAVVEGDPEVKAVVRAGWGLEVGHLLLQLVRSAVPAAEKSHPDSLLREIRQLAIDRLAEDLHQGVALVRRTSPVLGREAVDDERADVELD